MRGYVVAQFHAAHEPWGADPHLVGLEPDGGTLLWKKGEAWGLTSGGRHAARDGALDGWSK